MNKQRCVPLWGLIARVVCALDCSAPPPNISTLANNSIFETWRPKAHVLPPADHIGDPCMHYVDPKTGLFHVGYLYTLPTISGAGGATTNDLVTYHDVKPDVPLFIQSGGINDPLAVFDGSVVPSGLNDTPTLLYTSVSYFPIHWTLPYIKGSETQSLAVTYDGGRNFTKVREGPVIPGPPPTGSIAFDVTGFRDPFVFQNPQLDRQLSSEAGTWYVVISGGIHDIGPSQFLYRQYNPQFRDWEFLGQWWQEPANSTWGDGTWAGRWGFNFEVANAFWLNESGYDDEGTFFTTIGAEWGYAPVPPGQSPERNMLWASGEHRPNNGGQLEFEVDMAGFLDWGHSAYAAAGKPVTANSVVSQKSGACDRYIIYLWLTNDDFQSNDFPVLQQGWDSSLTTPRELAVLSISHVVDNQLPREVGSWRIEQQNPAEGTVKLVTLGQSIVREARSAYVSNAVRTLQQDPRSVASSDSNDAVFASPPMSRFFMMNSVIDFPSSVRGSDSDVKAGFRILSSEHESTLVYYQFCNESIIIDRSNSSAASSTTPGIVDYNEVGKLRLFDIVQHDSPGSRIESLNLTVLVDNSILELYANDRFVLSTWVWPWFESSTNIEYFVEGSSIISFGETHLYEGLVDAWPQQVR